MKVIFGIIALALLVGAGIYYFTGKIGSSDAKAEEAPKPTGKVVLKTTVDTWTWDNLTDQEKSDKYLYLMSLVKTAKDEKKPYIDIDKDELLIVTDDFKELYTR